LCTHEEHEGVLTNRDSLFPLDILNSSVHKNVHSDHNLRIKSGDVVGSATALLGSDVLQWFS
jgi:hypothetical protein